MSNSQKTMLVCVIIICISFFLPWVKVNSAGAGIVSKLISGKDKTPTISISGYDVPVMANGEESRLMISVIKLFQPKITNADKKSYLIWLIPLLSIAMFGVLFVLPNNPWIKLGFGVLGVLIFSVATFKVMTTDMDKIVMTIKIGIGLWLTFIGYLGIGLIQLLEFKKTKK